MSSALRIPSSLNHVELPFPHDPLQIPAKLSNRLVNFEKKDMVALADSVAAFYARFLTAEWRRNQAANIEFSREPQKYPTNEEVAKFQSKLGLSILERFLQRKSDYLSWSLTLSTAPSGLLAKACREIKSIDRQDIKFFFPTQSALSLHFWRNNQTMKVSWTSRMNEKIPASSSF